ncbi:hypothetical protein ACP70R_027819 [Stipagrostis hirtigluma subsp. patula]
MDEFSLSTDHGVLLQGRGMFATSTEASKFAADGYGGIANRSSERNTAGAQDESKKKGKELLFREWPELGVFDDLRTDLSLDRPTFEIGSNYLDGTLWSSICSPDAHLVPSSCFDNTDLPTVRNESTTDPVSQSSVSLPDQINTTHPTNIQQKSRTEGRAKPLSCKAHAGSSSVKIEQFSRHSDVEPLCPFDDIASTKQTGGSEGLEAILRSNREMPVPSAPSTMCSDEAVHSSRPGPDLVAAHTPRSAKKKRQAPLHGTPDMILDGMAENPLEMYFPPLTTHEQPGVVISGATAQTSHQFPVTFAGNGVMNRAGLQFGSKEGKAACAEPHELPRSKMVLEAVPVKDLRFQKLQEGMNQMDLATKSRIRDALYRLANGVEQRHFAPTGAVGSSGSTSKRSKSGGWIETQTNPMDHSVAKLLLQKPPYPKTVPVSAVPTKRRHVVPTTLVSLD